MNSKPTMADTIGPATSAVTKQMGTARGSNEQQTGVTEYEVIPGNTIRAGGRNYGEGEKVPLNATDAKRLLDQGRIKTTGDLSTSPAAKHLDANAPEVIASIEAGEFDAETLVQMAELETAGKGRKTVLEAIEAAQAAE